MNSVAKERFIESLKDKAKRSLQEFNQLKGGKERILKAIDEDGEHF